MEPIRVERSEIMANASRLYYPIGSEEQVFEAAFRQGMSVVLKGPTSVMDGLLKMLEVCLTESSS